MAEVIVIETKEEVRCHTVLNGVVWIRKSFGVNGRVKHIDNNVVSVTSPIGC